MTMLKKLSYLSISEFVNNGNRPVVIIRIYAIIRGKIIASDSAVICMSVLVFFKIKMFDLITAFNVRLLIATERLL